MIAKRYFTALVILLVFLGAYTKQYPAPNQEISLQFVDKKEVSDNADDLITAIKTTLQSVGVTEIQVREQDNGTLKITYYSDADVAVIKKVLSSIGVESEKDSNSIPTDKKVVAFKDAGSADIFKLDVYEIQTATNAFAGAHGKYILSFQKEYDKAPTSPSASGNTSAYHSSEQKITITLVYSESVYKPILKETISYEIPDVRAGPTSLVHS